MAPVTDPTQGQPSEEEIRAYLQQIREADPAAIVVQAYRLLGEGAELKLGRRDARVLIDGMAALTEAVDGRVDAKLVAQMREGVRQLQTAQVQAESQAGGEPAQQESTAAPGQAGAGAGPSDTEATPRPDATAQPSAPGGDKPLTDRLWIPGRQPGRP